MEARDGDAAELSAADTVIFFDRPLPLLRGPIPAGASDDPSLGPFVLAFRNAQSWESALRATRLKIVHQCEAAARMSCSITASNKCKTPWWKSLIGATTLDLAERQRCEEREMSICLLAAKDTCLQFTKEKTLSPFQDARVASMDPKLLSDCMAKDILAETNYRGSMLFTDELINEVPEWGIKNCISNDCKR